jgi:hypothetical protein
MPSKIDKELLDKRKKLDADHEDCIKSYKNYWKIFFIRPRNYLIAIILIICFICFGLYHDWQYKTMIWLAFTHGLSGFLVGIIEYIVIKKKS